ncbi:hypothetical protein D6827_03315 [Candidatus Parcubacteria bacterium]|nr:MAG: hypothetical protein D6827_03315 [Candidatus Parcubacteria bacterium]
MLKRVVFAIFLLIAVLFLLPQQSFADACECFCTSSTGAVSKGGVSSDTACQEICDVNYLGCFESEDDPGYPDNNPFCYTQYECEHDMVKIDGAEEPSVWGGQANNCPNGQGYCYAPMSDIELAVALLNPGDPDNKVSKIDTLPEYINVIYNLSIPVGALLAIVMIMIGGLQYMLARGDSGKITNAKKRISNAVIGLVLLLFAFTIANFMDPRFVELQTLQLPKIRTVTYLDPNSSCEALEEAGYTVELKITSGNSKEECGNQGTVTAVPDEQSQDSTWEVGDTCPYLSCSDDMETCVRTASENQCVRCGEAVDVDDFTPGKSTCSNLTHQKTSKDKDNEFFYCEYYDAGATEVSRNSCVELVYPGGNFGNNDSLDCDALAKDFGASCRAYDEVWGTAENVLDNELDDLQGADNDYPLLDKVCSNDPCGFAPPGQSCVVMNPETDDNLEGWCEGGSGIFFEVILGYLDCEDWIQRVDCVNSNYLQTLYDAEEGKEVDDPVCQDKDGNVIDCMTGI